MYTTPSNSVSDRTCWNASLKFAAVKDSPSCAAILRKHSGITAAGDAGVGVGPTDGAGIMGIDVVGIGDGEGTGVCAGADEAGVMLAPDEEEDTADVIPTEVTSAFATCPIISLAAASNAGTSDSARQVRNAACIVLAAFTLDASTA